MLIIIFWSFSSYWLRPFVVFPLDFFFCLTFTFLYVFYPKLLTITIFPIFKLFRRLLDLGLHWPILLSLLHYCLKLDLSWLTLHTPPYTDEHILQKRNLYEAKYWYLQCHPKVKNVSVGFRTSEWLHFRCLGVCNRWHKLLWFTWQMNRLLSYPLWKYWTWLCRKHL